MEIKWLGHACFAITHKGYTVVIDPYNSDYTAGYPRLRVRADKLLVSHEHYGHNYREGVVLSGRPESDCPFTIRSFEVWHDNMRGITRGKSLVHILEADGLKLVHMGDIGTQLLSGEARELTGADVMMVTAGSCTGLPSQEVWRLCEEVLPRVIVPMHYRFGDHGARRLEHVEDLLHYFNAPGLAHEYDTDTLVVTPDMEPQVALLKYLGPQAWGDLAVPEERARKKGLLARILRK